MEKSKHSLGDNMELLRAAARKRGMSDSLWGQLAGVRKETLSRLQHRQTCDLATLQALAEAVGHSLTVTRSGADPSFDIMPSVVNRDYEQQLLDLCASGEVSVGCWRALGSGFFMGGLAVMLASMPDVARRDYLALGEELHPGISQVGVFALWLERSPIRASRFFPMLMQHRRAA